MNKIVSFCVVLGLGCLSLSAQQKASVHQCMTDYYHQQAIASNPAYKAEEDRINQEISQNQPRYKSNGVVRIIPLVFHVIHVNGKENITREQILDQVRIMNEDFRKKAGTPGGSSTNPVAADCEIEFRLANRDPNGNCFDGVNRIYSTLTNDGDDKVKTQLVSSTWRSGKYLNIYVVANITDRDNDPNTTTLGYAQFPFSGASTTRGVLIRADYIGTIGTSSKAKGGRVLTHEVGHCFGLYHTFQDGCFGGDQIADTPPVVDQNFGSCSPSKNSCTNDVPDLPDQLENYMDYTDGDCQNMFSTGQKTRMDQMINTYYSTLVSAANLSATGVSGYTAPASTKVPPLMQDFESIQADNYTLSDGWVVENLTGNTFGWRTSDTAKSQGARSMYLPSFYHPTSQTRSTYNFYSPSFNLSLMQNAYLNFTVAYAQRIVTLSDTLTIYVSNDCGLTWNVAFKSGSSGLATSPLQTTAFVPQDQSKWKTLSVNLAPYRTSNVKIRFEFFYFRGNNMFIDNIQVSNQQTGISLQAPAFAGVNVYPNPTATGANIDFTLQQAGEVKAALYNMMGQQVGFFEMGELERGSHSFFTSQLGEAVLPEGIYLIKLMAGGQENVSRLIIAR